MSDPNKGGSDTESNDNTPEVSASELGQLDNALYGDLLTNFGDNGPMNNDYLARVTGSSEEDVRAAHHDARNDSGVRDQKPYSND